MSPADDPEFPCDSVEPLTEEERERFDLLLEKETERLPAQVHSLLESVPIIVDDEPSPDILEEMGIDPSEGPPDLCGLNWGVPLSERSVLYETSEMSRIHLFRGPIYRLAGRSRRELHRQIRITLLHEIGHLFGFDEEKLEQLGYD